MRIAQSFFMHMVKSVYDKIILKDFWSITYSRPDESNYNSAHCVY